MTRYIALIDGETGGYGAAFPDIPGCTAMGETMDATMVNAATALADYIDTARAYGETVPDPRALEVLRDDPEVREALAAGAGFASIALVSGISKPVKANLSLDAGVLAAIDDAAGRLKITRSAMVELLARQHLATVG